MLVHSEQGHTEIKSVGVSELKFDLCKCDHIKLASLFIEVSNDKSIEEGIL